MSDTTAAVMFKKLLLQCFRRQIAFDFIFITLNGL